MGGRHWQIRVWARQEEGIPRHARGSTYYEMLVESQGLIQNALLGNNELPLEACCVAAWRTERVSQHAIQLGYDLGGYDIVPGFEAVHVTHEGERQEAGIAHKHSLQGSKAAQD